MDLALNKIVRAARQTYARLVRKAGVGALVPLVGRFYAAGELAVQTHFLEVEDEHTRLTARFAVLGEVSLAFWLAWRSG